MALFLVTHGPDHSSSETARQFDVTAKVATTTGFELTLPFIRILRYSSAVNLAGGTVRRGVFLEE